MDEFRRARLRVNPFVLAFLVGIVTLTALRPLLRHIPDPPPVVGEVPAFTLTDQDGRPFGRADLAGRVTIANFFCTRCGSPTPEVMTGLRRIADAYKERGIGGIRFLSISMDPRSDTPERLREYARAIGAEPDRWSMLTGDAVVTRDLAAGLFKNVSMVAAEAGLQGASAMASGEGARTKPLVLIDQRSRIRGWYAADEMGLDEVYNRAQHVLHQAASQQ